MNRITKPTAEHILKQFKDKQGVSISEHSYAAPMLLVLLRHVGCAFCRQALHELSLSMKHITECGYRVGLVHMEDDTHVDRALRHYGLDLLPRFRDKDRRLYKAFGLGRATVNTFFSRDMWIRGLRARREHGSEFPKADPMQLPGTFLVDQGHIVAGEAVMSPHDTPDFIALLIRSEAAA